MNLPFKKQVFLCLLFSIIPSFAAKDVDLKSKILVSQAALNLCKKFDKAEGFLAGTLVKTIDGYRPIESLALGERVISYDLDGKECQATIVQIHKKMVKSFVVLQIGEKAVHVGPDQKFFLPEKGDWIKAKNIALSNRFLIKSDQVSSALEIKLKDETVDVYSISLDEHHNFCVTQDDILVHNKMHKNGSGHHHNHTVHNSHSNHSVSHNNHPERNTAKVGNMHDWLKNHQTGQAVSGNFEKHPHKNDAWRAKDKIKVDGEKRLDKGDYIKLDRQHQNHFEHFDKGDNRKGVLNLDLKQNAEKTARAKGKDNE